MRPALLFILLLGYSNIHAQRKSLNLSRWHVSDKVEMSDYQLIRKAGLYYDISNDNDNIYIGIKVDDKGVQNRILREGLTIWINMDGKEVKTLGVRFPIGSQNQAIRKKSDLRENKTNPDESNITPLALATTIELIGFINEEERRFPSDNNDNFRGSVRYDAAGAFFYRMVMPIAKLPVRNSRGGTGAMPFTLGIEYGSAPPAGKPELNRGPSPSEVRAGKSPHGASELFWISNVRLATSK
jgi:hypothetical protein